MAWSIKDTSTNGTFVNGVRVPKNGRLPLVALDLIRLSQPQGNDPTKLLECFPLPIRHRIQLLQQHSPLGLFDTIWSDNMFCVLIKPEQLVYCASLYTASKLQRQAYRSSSSQLLHIWINLRSRGLVPGTVLSGVCSSILAAWLDLKTAHMNWQYISPLTRELPHESPRERA